MGNWYQYKLDAAGHLENRATLEDSTELSDSDTDTALNTDASSDPKATE